jgi:hypothetical protein
MTPKEKCKELRTLFAQELIDLTDNEDLLNSRIKNCALIAVDEKLETLNTIKFVIDCIDLRQYYLEVKQEIEKL